MFDPHTLTLAVAGSSELLQQSQQAAQSMADSMEELWTSVITPESSIYAEMARLGVVFAVGSMVLWGIKIVQDFVDGGSTSFLHELIWPLIVIHFLAGNGLHLAQMTLGIRAALHNVNQELVTNVSAGYSLQEAFDTAKARGAAQAEIGALIRQCQALSGRKQTECIRHAAAQAEEIIQNYNLEGDWVTNLINRVVGAISEARAEDATDEGDILSEAGDDLRTVFSPLNALIGAANQSVVRGLLLACQQAFQQSFELALLLTGLLGPLALGGSLLPLPVKPLIAWITGMFSIGVAKLCLNIVVGFGAAIVAQSDAGDPLWFLLFIGFLAPTLAMSIAAGGGMAVWNIVSEGQMQAVEAAAGVTTAVVTKGRSAGAKA